MSSLRKQSSLLTIALCLLASVSAHGLDFSTDPAVKGREITEETDRRNKGFGDTQAEITMTLKSATGEVSERQLRMRSLEEPKQDLGDKSLIVFDLPKDVEGTTLLTHTNILNPDDQWIYLPSVARVKRISSANKSGPFLGSEFAYEDLTALEVGKYSYLWLRDEACPPPTADRTCHVVERQPLYENSGYARQIAWTDNQDFQMRKVEFYNRQGALLKTLTLSDYRLYLDKFWRAHDLMMENHITGKSTRLVWRKVDFHTGLARSDFDESALERLR
jgi:outer membrane lipoprotein-sorting protein